ncbi:dual specificity tyrosine-phosphorylation-regulated kinase 2-like [Lampetra planeri]
MSGTTWSALSSAGTASIRSKSPQEILNLFGPNLNQRERKELAAMREVWYFSLDSGDRPGGIYNSGYDNDEEQYVPVRHEHLNFRYQVLKMIGEGGQGLVVQCLDHKTNNLVAVKILASPYNPMDEKSHSMELRISRELQSERSDVDHGVIRVLSTFHFRGHSYIVLELLKASLHQVIKEAGQQLIDMDMVKTYTRGILLFLSHVKSRGIVHADIKPDNVLVKDTVAGTVRVTDFGTRFYVAPELLLGYLVTYAIDMWALGCTVAEMVIGRELFPSLSNDDHLPCCIEILGKPPRFLVDGALHRNQYFDRRRKPYSPEKRRIPGRYPLERILWGHSQQLINFISCCLRAEPEQPPSSSSSTSSPLAQNSGERAEDVEEEVKEEVVATEVEKKTGDEEEVETEKEESEDEEGDEEDDEDDDEKEKDDDKEDDKEDEEDDDKQKDDDKEEDKEKDDDKEDDKEEDEEDDDKEKDDDKEDDKEKDDDKEEEGEDDKAQKDDNKEDEQEEEEKMEEVQQQLEKRKRGDLERVGRALRSLRSLLRRMLRYSGRPTTQ